VIHFNNCSKPNPPTPLKTPMVFHKDKEKEKEEQKQQERKEKRKRKEDIRKRNNEP
jgi:hypothetical protein